MSTTQVPSPLNADISRKRCRQKRAIERDRMLKDDKTSLSYLTWLAEQEALELANEQSVEHLRQDTHRQWLEYYSLVQGRWKIKQEKLAKIQEEKLIIRAEFETNKECLRKLKEEKIHLAERKIEQQQRLAVAIERFNRSCNPSKAMCTFL